MVDRSRQGVFLDRDGVLNAVTIIDGVTHPPDSASDVRVLPGVREAVAALKDVGLALLVVSNQPDVARGTQARERVEEINAVLRRELPVDDIDVCYHDNADNCSCRKPKPGMLLRSAARHGVDPARSVMVGDRASDVAAGRAAGCATVLIAPMGTARGGADHVASSLLESVPWILSTLRMRSARTLPN